MNPSFDSYVRAFQDQWSHLLTSILVAVGATVLSLAVAVPGAYALARYRIPGASAFLLVILLTQMIPGIVVANALYGAYSNLGLLNSIPGLILADASLGIPFALAPLVKLSGDRALMGRYTNKPALQIVAWIVVALIVALNVALIVLTLGGFA